MTFGGSKQRFSALSFLNWQRAKVLLKLEFDTEDQVLFHINFISVLGEYFVEMQKKIEDLLNY